MRTTIKTEKEQLMGQYFSKLEKFEERLEAAGIETHEYYELLDLFRSYTMIDAKERQEKKDRDLDLDLDLDLDVVVLDGNLERMWLKGTKSGSLVFATLPEANEKIIQRAKNGTLMALAK
uniref:Uncharacterized protein n=1 Tax=Exiguobacterium sp. S3-2 TaxID=1389960 RepID=V9Z7N5_9BACL|nr:hypothetical protein [Exiguobacterium sp. S3-2]AHE40567.1 hypothetical protein [Exiguobacterium sp. S3-2]